jgi:hypothetical protein
VFANNYKRILVLGAGFSKSFSESMPLIKDFSAGLLGEIEGDFGRLKWFVQKFNNLSNQSGDFLDFEQLGTLIFTKRIFKDFEEEIHFTHLKNQYLKYIYDCIIRYGVDNESFGIFSEFIKRVSCSWRARLSQISGEYLLITFNYDLLFEHACEDLGHSLNQTDLRSAAWNYGVTLKSYNEDHFYDASDKYYFDILKLHGSLNWFKAKGAESVDHHNIYEVNRTDRNFPIHRHDAPCFIPMAHSKDSFLTGTLYNTLWSIAHNHFKEASEITFIGYGFPDTDLNNLCYFLEFKDKIKTIVIKEYAGSERLARLKKIFGESKVINMDAKEYIKENILNAVP